MLEVRNVLNIKEYCENWGQKRSEEIFEHHIILEKMLETIKHQHFLLKFPPFCSGNFMLYTVIVLVQVS
jgi:hypothetical protein